MKNINVTIFKEGRKAECTCIFTSCNGIWKCLMFSDEKQPQIFRDSKLTSCLSKLGRYLGNLGHPVTISGENVTYATILETSIRINACRSVIKRARNNA